MKTNLQARFPQIMMGVGVILVLGSLFWFVYATRSSIRPSFADFPVPTSEVPNPEVPRVSVADAKAAYDQGTAVFLDVRGGKQYAEAHISGALSIPEGELPDHLNGLDTSAWIIAYCI